MLPGFIQPLDVAYLGSAPRDMDTLTKATLHTLTCFTPPLEGYRVSVVGGATIGGVAMSHSIVVLNSSIAVYIQQKDVQGWSLYLVELFILDLGTKPAFSLFAL